jgi:uncharacterized protein (DUF1778 family)
MRFFCEKIRHCTDNLRTFEISEINMSTTIKQQSRFDVRLLKEQKEFFERAAYLGGFRNLTDFVVSTIQEKAKEILKEKDQIIASEKDAQVFFDALANPKKPSKALKNALKEYNLFVSNEQK